VRHVLRDDVKSSRYEIEMDVEISTPQTEVLISSREEGALGERIGFGLNHHFFTK